jgi:hypothetical protein
LPRELSETEEKWEQLVRPDLDREGCRRYLERERDLVLGILRWWSFILLLPRLSDREREQEREEIVLGLELPRRFRFFVLDFDLEVDFED